MEKDYQKEAWKLHLEFHQRVLEPLDTINVEIRQVKEYEALAGKLGRSTTLTHDFFDTLMLWIEQMQKEIYRLQGQLREAEELAVLLKTGVRKREEGKSCIGGLT